jgi:CRISPR-associated protein Csm5
MTRYRLKLTTLTPLHIGSGGSALRRGIDFVGYDQTIYVFATTRVLEYLLADSTNTALLDQITRTVNLASFLQEQDFQEHPDLVLYRLHGAASVNEVLPHLKDVYDCPYIPGSSVKGALRTAIIDAALLARNTPVDVRRLGDRAKFAAQELERDIVGRGEKHWQAPNYDLFRAVQIADSEPGERTWFTLSNVAVWPAGDQGIPLDVETLASGSVFTLRMKIDDYLFGPQARKVDFGPRRRLLDNLAATCRAQAQARIAGETAFFARRNEPRVRTFYEHLAAQLADCGPQSFFVHLGWGTGWGSKTIARTLQASEGAIEKTVQRYRLDRGKGRGGGFPATRHVVVNAQREPVEPLGWVRVDMEEVER